MKNVEIINFYWSYNNHPQSSTNSTQITVIKASHQRSYRYIYLYAYTSSLTGNEVWCSRVGLWFEQICISPKLIECNNCNSLQSERKTIPRCYLISGLESNRFPIIFAATPWRRLLVVSYSLFWTESNFTEPTNCSRFLAGGSPAYSTINLCSFSKLECTCPTLYEYAANNKWKSSTRIRNCVSLKRLLGISTAILQKLNSLKKCIELFTNWNWVNETSYLSYYGSLMKREKIEINLLSIMFLLTLLRVQYPQQSQFSIIRQPATSPRQYNTMQNTITTYVLVSYVGP